MLREIDLLRLLLSYHREWENNPETFLEMTILVSSIDCRCIQSGEVNFEEIMGPKLDNVAKIFMGLTPVNLAPYKDFCDLKRHGHPSNKLSEMLVNVSETINQMEESGNAELALNKLNVETYFKDRDAEKLLLKLWPYIATVED